MTNQERAREIILNVSNCSCGECQNTRVSLVASALDAAEQRGYERGRKEAPMMTMPPTYCKNCGHVSLKKGDSGR